MPRYRRERSVSTTPSSKTPLSERCSSPCRHEASASLLPKAKFYFFDIGVVHALIGQHQLAEGTDSWGRAFETFIFMELSAHASYAKDKEELAFWRTIDHEEVDFVWRGEVAIEVKASRHVHVGDLKGLAALHEDQHMRRRICVCREKERRRIGEFEIVPYQEFLDELWGDAL